MDGKKGQSIINIKSGGRTRLSALVAPVSLMIFILFGSSFVNVIPLAGLVGVMFMVVVGTFKWESLKYGGKVPKNDLVVVVVVSVVTIFADLATAVIIGVILAALMFAWEKGQVIDARIEENEEGTKKYKIYGTVFFGSVLNFRDLFDVQKDPKNVILDLKHAKVMDHSALEIINDISQRYDALGKTMTIIRPSDSCRLLFKKAEDILDLNFEDEEINLHLVEDGLDEIEYPAI